MWAKIKRYQEQLKNENDLNVIRDLKAIIVGMTNFYLSSKKWNVKAKERFENHCSKCEIFINEPLESEKVIDKDIPKLSGKICGSCGCVESYKLRQSIKPCKFWK